MFHYDRDNKSNQSDEAEISSAKIILAIVFPIHLNIIRKIRNKWHAIFSNNQSFDWSKNISFSPRRELRYRKILKMPASGNFPPVSLERMKITTVQLKSSIIILKIMNKRSYSEIYILIISNETNNQKKMRFLFFRLCTNFIFNFTIFFPFLTLNILPISFSIIIYIIFYSLVQHGQVYGSCAKILKLTLFIQSKFL